MQLWFYRWKYMREEHGIVVDFLISLQVSWRTCTWSVTKYDANMPLDKQQFVHSIALLSTSSFSLLENFQNYLYTLYRLLLLMLMLLTIMLWIHNYNLNCHYYVRRLCTTLHASFFEWKFLSNFTINRLNCILSSLIVCSWSVIFFKIGQLEKVIENQL